MKSKTIKYLRETSGSKKPTRLLLGSTNSKHIASEVDELIRRRLTTRIKPSTNSRPVVIVASDNPDLVVGREFASSREACRELEAGTQDLSLAFYRSKTVDKKGLKIGTIQGVTFKQLTKSNKRRRV